MVSPEDSLMDVPHTPAPAKVETQGSQAEAPGELRMEPDLGHPPRGIVSHHTSSVPARQY